MDDVDAILDGLDDRREKPHVPLPEKNAVEGRRPAGGLQLPDFVHVVGQRDDRSLYSGFPKLAGEGDRRCVPDVGRRDDEVVAGPIPSQRERLFRRRHVGDRRRRTHVQVEKLLEDDLLQLAVLGEDERVVQARNEQDVADPEPGQVREARQTRRFTRRDAGIGTGVWHLEGEVNLTRRQDSTSRRHWGSPPATKRRRGLCCSPASYFVWQAATPAPDPSSRRRPSGSRRYWRH